LGKRKGEKKGDGELYNNKEEKRRKGNTDHNR